MRVGEKRHLREYFTDPRFQDKIPNLQAPGAMPKAGDNIYRPLVPGASEPEHFEQLRNPNHWGGMGPSEADRQRDISGQYVLIADEFYYFGANALSIPADIRPYLPSGQSAQGRLTPQGHAERFIRFIRDRYQTGRHGNPTQWPDEKSVPATTGSCGAH
ncbi:Nucleotide modification associated domain 2 [compost metagenome]